MTDKKETLRRRLKDVLWGLRQKYPTLTPQIDRIMPILAFDKSLTERQLSDLFIEYPFRSPPDYHLITLKQVQLTTQRYHYFITTKKGFYKAHTSIRELEQILRKGFEGYRLVYNEVTGYEMVER